MANRPDSDEARAAPRANGLVVDCTGVSVCTYENIEFSAANRLISWNAEPVGGLRFCAQVATTTAVYSGTYSPQQHYWGIRNQTPGTHPSGERLHSGSRIFCGSSMLAPHFGHTQGRPPSIDADFVTRPLRQRGQTKPKANTPMTLMARKVRMDIRR